MIGRGRVVATESGVSIIAVFSVVEFGANSSVYLPSGPRLLGKEHQVTHAQCCLDKYQGCTI